MRAGLVMVLALVCAGSLQAQRPANASGKDGARPKSEAAMIRIREITGVGGNSDYTVTAPQVEEKWKKKINHSSSYAKDSVKGWHFFEVAYQVRDEDAMGKPIFVLPEVEITYALLYDMHRSKRVAGIMTRAKKAGGAVGLDNPKQLYSLFTETFTYTSITPGRDHYAAVCVPPSAIAVYGEPLLFSVQIKVNGVPQGDIETQAVGGATIDGKKIDELKTLLYAKGADGKPHPAAWWEQIENMSKAVVKRDGILRDRSATPFALAGDMYYDQVKAR